MDIKDIVKKAKEIAEEVECLPDDIRLITFEKLLEKAISSSDAITDRAAGKAETKPGEKGKKELGKGKKGSKSESWKMDGSLDLSGGKSGKSLKDLFEEKRPSSNHEKTTLFVYYLIRHLSAETVDHRQIYTCYKHIKLRVPKWLKQNVIDIINRKGWLKKEKDNILLTTAGENLVEIELPRRATKNG